MSAGGWESLGEIIARLRDAEEEARTREGLNPDWASAEDVREAWDEADRLREEAEAARVRVGATESVDELVRAAVEREYAEEAATPRSPFRFPPPFPRRRA